MVFDLELVRHFLIDLHDGAIPKDQLMTGADPADKLMRLLEGEGLTEAIEESSAGATTQSRISLTSAGHLFAERIRGEAVWRQAIDSLKEEKASPTLGQLKLRLLGEQH